MAGRKRHQVPRTASGRRSRALDAYTENVEPILARMRLFGLSEPDARDQRAGTYIGRLNLTGELSEAQYDAAQRYLEMRERYQRALRSPDALRSSTGSASNPDDEEYSRRCRIAIERFKALEVAITMEQCIHRGAALFAALDYIVCRNQSLPHLVGDLRIALNAVVHHLGLGD